MKFILAEWLTLGLALLWDRFLYSAGVNQLTRVGFLVPIGEELLKYGVSYLSKLFPPLLYAGFGFGEGIYESLHDKKRLDLVLVLAGILPHTFFSIFFVFKIPIWLSLILAIISHAVWNWLVLNFKNDCNRSAN
jgi:hypothetical protein